MKQDIVVFRGLEVYTFSSLTLHELQIFFLVFAIALLFYSGTEGHPIYFVVFIVVFESHILFAGVSTLSDLLSLYCFIRSCLCV